MEIAASEKRSALESLPETRRAIVTMLKRSETSSADEIAAKIGITSSAIRQHLAALRADGLIQFGTGRGSPGRPVHRYTLTTAGDSLFPRNYVDLTNELLDYVGEEDAELLGRVWARRANARLEKARERSVGLAFGERVAMIATILDEDGYLADFTELGDGRFRLTEHNCAVLAIAQRHHHACSTELSFLEALLPDATVTRVAHRLKSGHVCAYEICRDGSTG